MTQYNTLNVKLSNSQLFKLKSAIKNGTEVTLNLSSNPIGSSNDETNFPHKLLLTNTQVSKICKTINFSSTNLKFSKTQLSKITQLGVFIDVLDLIMNPHNPEKTFKKIINKVDKLSKKVAMNDIIKTANDFKSVIKALQNASDKFYGTGIILTDKEIKDIMKVIKFLENRGIL